MMRPMGVETNRPVGWQKSGVYQFATAWEHEFFASRYCGGPGGPATGQEGRSDRYHRRQMNRASLRMPGFLEHFAIIPAEAEAGTMMRAHGPAEVGPFPSEPLTCGKTLRSGADRGRVGSWNGLVFAVGLCLVGLSAFANVDAAFEEGAVFNGDAGCDNVAGERAVTANIDAVAGSEIATDFAEHDDFTGIDVGGDYAVASDGDAVAGEVDGTLHAAIDVERFGAGDFAFDDERFADGGLVSSSSGDRPGSDWFSGHGGRA